MRQGNVYCRRCKVAALLCGYISMALCGLRHRVCIYGFIYGRRSSCILALHCGWLNDGCRCGWVARGPRCSERWSDVVKYSVDASRDAVYAFVQSPARDGGNLCVCTPNDLHHASKLDHVPSLHRAKLQRHIIGVGRARRLAEQTPARNTSIATRWPALALR